MSALGGMRGAIAGALAAAALVAVGAVPARARAQEGTAETITLDDAVRIVREESGLARALRARAAVADAEVALAGVYPNPALSYVFMGRFDGTDAAINGSQHQVWLDVPLLIAGQHDARRDVAAVSAVAERAEVESGLLGLEIEARRAFVALLAAQDRVARLESARGELAHFRTIVEGRTGAGAQSPYDAARIAIEASRVEASLASARADVREAASRLAALAGRRGWQPRASGTLEDDEAGAAGVEQLPSVRAARLRAEAAERDVRRAELERIPEIAVGLGAYLTSDPDSGSVYAGLSIPLPIFDTGEAAVRRARAARDAAAEARDAIEERAEAWMEGALDVLRARRDALRVFDTEALGRVPELQRMAEASYRLGASGVFELLDAFRARLELELARIELLEDVAEAAITIRAIAASGL